MSHQSVIPAEQGVTAQASVVTALGYPNGRAETSPTPTGWQASAVLADGSADLSAASVTVIATSTAAGK